MKNIEIGDVMLYAPDHPSHSWNSGLFVILAIKNEEIYMCKLNKFGIPDKFEDGRYMSSVISINSDTISLTKLKYELEPNFQYG